MGVLFAFLKGLLSFLKGALFDFIRKGIKILGGDLGYVRTPLLHFPRAHGPSDPKSPLSRFRGRANPPPFSRTSVPVGQDQPPFSDNLSPSLARVDRSTSNRSTSNRSSLSRETFGPPSFFAAGRGHLPPPRTNVHHPGQPPPGLHHAAASTATEPLRHPTDDESAAAFRDSLSVALGSAPTSPGRHHYSDASVSQFTEQGPSAPQG